MAGNEESVIYMYMYTCIYSIYNHLEACVRIIYLQTGEEYMTAVDTTHSGRPPLYLNVIEGSAFCHDATWSLAKALSNVMNGMLG